MGLICLLSRDSCSLLTDVQCLENHCFIHFTSFFFLDGKGKSDSYNSILVGRRNLNPSLLML